MKGIQLNSNIGFVIHSDDKITIFSLGDEFFKVMKSNGIMMQGVAQYPETKKGCLNCLYEENSLGCSFFEMHTIDCLTHIKQTIKKAINNITKNRIAAIHWISDKEYQDLKRTNKGRI